jgi:transcription termination/antitermination protein NusA
MSIEILKALELLEREKGIKRDILIHAIEEAVTAAAQKVVDPTEEIETEFDLKTGELKIFVKKVVVENIFDDTCEISLDMARLIKNDATINDVIRIPKESKELGRIAAHKARQVITQKVRDEEREITYSEFIQKKGEIAYGVVQQVEKNGIIVDVKRAECILPTREQVQREIYKKGDYIRAYILDIIKTEYSLDIILSRRHPQFLVKLFEVEVPEIYEGIVEIKGVVREPGERSKISVISREKDVDPVGACVGMKGSRVQSVVRELRGEKIDIIEYTTNIRNFIINALSPAKINKIEIYENEKAALVIVDESHLSLAIGKKGQNVRLASRLVGWNIDIKSEANLEKERLHVLTEAMKLKMELQKIPGIGRKSAQKLVDMGLSSVEKIFEAGREKLLNVPGFTDKLVEKIFDSCRKIMKKKGKR